MEGPVIDTLSQKNCSWMMEACFGEEFDREPSKQDPILNKALVLCIDNITVEHLFPKDPVLIENILPLIFKLCESKVSIDPALFQAATLLFSSYCQSQTEKSTELKCEDPTALVYWGFSLLKIAEFYIPANEASSNMYFNCITNARELFQKSLKVKESAQAFWGIGLSLLLQVRRATFSTSTSETNKARIQELLLAKSKKNLVSGRLLMNSDKDLGFPNLQVNFENEPQMLGLAMSCYYLACVCCLRKELDDAHYWLLGAKAEQKIPSISYLTNSSYLKLISSQNEFWNTMYQKHEDARKKFDKLTLANDKSGVKKEKNPQNQPPQPQVQHPSPLPTDTSPSSATTNENSEKNNGSSDTDSTEAKKRELTNSVIQSAMSKSTMDFLTDKLSISVNLGYILKPVENPRIDNAKTRLKGRLALYSMKERREIPGDGNCQMLSIADQLFRDLSRHTQIRANIVSWLRENKNLKLPNDCKLCDFVYDGTWEGYCDSMSRSGTWGDHLTLISAAELYGSKVVIISSVEGDNFITEINPMVIKNNNVIMLCHYAEFHYGSIEPVVV